MKININNYKWTVKFEDPDADVLNNGGCFIGLTVYQELKIYIRKGLPEEVARSTVIHELCHAFLFTYGIQADDYDEEQVCNFFGTHADRILKLTDRIMRGGGY